MAFFGSEKRDLQVKVVNPNVGPGKYVAPDSQTDKRKGPAYAPFCSVQKRFQEVKDQKPYVGPGSYNLSGQVGSPSFIKIQNQHSIIVKINDFGSSAFRSNIERFADSGTDAPGPGQYSVIPDHSFSAVSQLTQADQQMKKMKHTRKRTVSTGHPVLRQVRDANKQYQEAKQMGALAKQVPQYHQLSSPNSLGPGSYEIASGSFAEIASGNKRPKGVSWSLNQKQRFDTAEQYAEFNDEAYYQQEVEAFKRNRQKAAQVQPSTAFKSETVKTFFDQIVYHTNNHMKAEIRKRLGYKDAGPAPGSYLPVYHNNNKKDNGSWRFQFFGSTQERFRKDEEHPKVGPADYVLKDSMLKTGFRRPRPDNTKRSDLVMKDQTPGPGCYSTEKPLGKQPGRVQQFGSLMPRFRTESDSEIRRVTQSQLMKQISTRTNSKASANVSRQQPPASKPHSSCIFRSSTERDVFEESKDKQINSPLGIYDVTAGDIGSKLARKKGYLLNLEYCFLRRPAFDSTVHRFRTEESVNQTGSEVRERRKSLNVVVSDGSLVKKRHLQNKPIKKQGGDMSVMFKSDVPRAPFSVKNKGPGAGRYQSQQYLVRKSFNKRYQKR